MDYAAAPDVAPLNRSLAEFVELVPPAPNALPSKCLLGLT